ncbi:MAG: hypothetical protein IIC04_01135 [Proteobacteria bacterium]|nr:hypothetical protein [Pseudomonadota bacterium]
MPGDEFFHSAAENLAFRVADDQTKILQETAHLVSQIALDLHQQGAAVQDRPGLMTREPLDPDFLVPTAPHDPGRAHGVVAVALVDSHRQRRLGMTGIDASFSDTSIPT